MSSSWNKCRPIFGSVLLTLAVAFGTLFGIPLFKTVLTGSAGPNTEFLATIVAAPIAFLILGAVRSRATLVMHLGALALGAGVLWVSYPSDPLMDFQRQITHLARPVVLAVYLLGCLWATAQYLNPRARVLTS